MNIILIDKSKPKWRRYLIVTKNITPNGINNLGNPAIINQFPGEAKNGIEALGKKTICKKNETPD